jgi:nitrous oxidase accessory protein
MTVDSNIVADNNVGLFFEATRDNVFRHNIIARNDVALQMFQNSTGNVFSENDFVDNLSPLLIVGKKTESSWSSDRRGNYWSEYDGYDLDDDGIGDIPMKIQNVFQYLEGRTPHLRLYLYSPASQALAVSARAFPVMDFTSEIDERPLIRPVGLSGSPAMELAKRHRSDTGTIDRQSGWMFLIPGFSLAVGIAGLFAARRRRP